MSRSKLARILSPLGFCLALLSTPHCAQKETTETVGPDEFGPSVDGVILSAATWTLDWNTEGVQFDPTGGFSLETNLGYRLHINAGQVVLHRVALIPCPTNPADTQAFFPLSIASAHAHEEDSDPSSMEALKIADVVQPKLLEVGANAFAPGRYCQVYWLVARGMEGAVGAGGLDMSNRSIYFEGTWERNGESGSLLIDTWWPAGIILDLESITEPEMYTTAAAESSVHFTWIGIELPLGRIFDDIEFGVDSEAIVTDSILDNIIAEAAMTVDLQTP
jgi:hypothetical protein